MTIKMAMTMTMKMRGQLTVNSVYFIDMPTAWSLKISCKMGTEHHKHDYMYIHTSINTYVYGNHMYVYVYGYGYVYV